MRRCNCTSPYCCSVPATTHRHRSQPLGLAALLDHLPLIYLAREVGIEPTPTGLESVVLPLYYTLIYGDPYRIRTYDLLLRRQLLYPAELRNQIFCRSFNLDLSSFSFFSSSLISCLTFSISPQTDIIYQTLLYN